MKFTNPHIILIALAILIFLGGVIWVSVTQASIGNLQVYSGSAEIIRDSQSKSGQSGSAVNENDTIKTSSGSKIAIVLKDSSVVRIDENSEVEIADISYQEGKIKDATFKLKIGRFWSRVSPLPQGGNFDVETPTVVASVRGTSFNTTYLPEITGVYVYKDKVNVKLKKINETTLVPESLVLRMSNDNIEEDFKKGPQIPDPKYFDSWIKFNQEEDDRVCRDNHNTPGCEDYIFSSPFPSPSATVTPISSPAVQGAATTPIKTTRPTPNPSRILSPTQNTTSSPSQSGYATPNTPNPTSKSSSSPATTPSPTKSLTNFTITHDNTQNDCYPNCQFSAWAYYSDNPQKAVDVTKNTKWSLKSPTNGTISASGYYSSGQIRGDTIQAAYDSSNNHGTATHTIPPPVFL